MPVNTFMVTPNTPRGRMRCTDANEAGLNRPKMRRDTTSTVANTRV